MRKLLLLPIFVGVFLADFGAFAANARGSRGTANTANSNATSAPVAARAAVRSAAKPTTNTTAKPAPVAARAATRNTVKTSNATTAQSSSGGSVAARAGAKQKVINMGTKISAAASNTVVDQECQNAYFGCMDSFCMLENVTGGRCKCSDKNAEYDEMLVQIQNLDQQSYVMQTEGVELLKMGKSADEVYAMAQDAADKVTGAKKEEADAKKKGLDLSAWNKDWFDDDDLFEEDDAMSPLDSDLTSKTGDKLHSMAARVCTQEIPTQCKGAVSMLRMLYVQKIQSDCAAYSNSLKQQQLESTQKLQTARQSLRETALEKYQEANKYDLGGCVREFNTCMQGDDACGDGFQNCVTFAAQDNLQNNKAGTVAKPYEISGKYSSFVLAASTMEQLTSKRVFCETVLDQCVKVKDQVWEAFLKSAAPVIKTAESDAESTLRMGCVREVAECFRTNCADQMDANKENASYDMCLSNPELYKSLCKPKLEPCLAATGGSYDNPTGSTLWNALLARLASMKADACTKEVKECLTSDEVCGKDFAGCIGLTTYDIGNLCPADKLTACMKEYNPDTAREYIEKVAQGIALNIDNSFLEQCQSALKTAMLTHCGAEGTCPNAQLDESMFKGTMRVELCNGTDCSLNPNHFANNVLIGGNVIPTLRGKVDIAQIYYDGEDSSGNYFRSAGKSSDREDAHNYDSVALTNLQKTLTTAYKNMVAAVESDPKVQYCMSGRDVQGWANGSKLSTANKDNARFPNLTKSMRDAVAQQLINSISPIYFAEQEKVLQEQMASMAQSLSNAVNEVVQITQEKQDLINKAACDSLGYCENKPGKHQHRYNYYCNTMEYDSTTATCTMTRNHWHRGCFGGACDWHHDIQDQKFVWQLPKVTKTGLKDGESVTSQTTIQSEIFGGKTFEDYK